MIELAGLRALIPLDGTELSETALRPVRWLKSLGFGDLQLASIWEGLWELPEEDSIRPDLADLEEKGTAFLNTYLEGQRAKIESPGFEVKTSVLVGRPAEQILDLAASVKPDLIVIATHGRSGVERWRLGSVADKVVRGAECAILVIGPNVVTDLDSFSMQKILLPLDGSKDAEAALPIAVSLASASHARLDVVDVVSVRDITMVASQEYSLDAVGILEDAAKAYLAEVSSRSAITEAVSFHVLRGYPPDALIDWSKTEKTDLVVMTTHARHGLARTILGSVTDRMLLGPAPVLILRAEQAATSRLAGLTAAETVGR